MAQEKGLLIDIKRCIGCLSCETACKQLHGFGTDPEPVLSDTAFTVVEARGDKFVRKLCMHCEDPACASACPVGSHQQDPAGPGGLQRRQMHWLPLLHAGVPVSGAALSVDQAGAVREEVRSVHRPHQSRQIDRRAPKLARCRRRSSAIAMR